MNEALDRRDAARGLPSLGGLEKEYPALFPYRTDPMDELSPEEEREAKFEERLKHIQPFLVKRTRRLHRMLGKREAAHVSLEDMFQTFCLALWMKDAKWNPERGRYILFANEVCKTAAEFLHRKARTVTAPKSCWSRLKDCDAAEAAGTLTEKKARTQHVIRKVLVGAEQIPEGGSGIRPLHGAKEPNRALDPRAINYLRQALNGLEDQVICRRYGIETKEQRNSEICSSLGISKASLRQVHDSALRKMKVAWESMPDLTLDQWNETAA